MKTDPVENSHPNGKLFKYLQVEEAFEKYDIGGKRWDIFHNFYKLFKYFLFLRLDYKGFCLMIHGEQKE